MRVILLVEDDRLVSSFIETALRAAGYSTAIAADSALAAAMAASGTFDLVILDMMLLDGDGLPLLRSLRINHPGLPIIVITGQPERRGVVDCLDGGADDYLVKPLRIDELLARVRRRLAGGEPAHPTSVTVGDIRIDLLTRRVVVAGCATDVTGREYALLETLARHPDQVLSRAQLLSNVWGQDFDPMTNVIAVAIGKLRRKIGHERIETVRGAGYRLRMPRRPGR